jgi:RES domain-containing protein
LDYFEDLVNQIDRKTWPVGLKISSLNVGAHGQIITPTVEELPEKWSELTYHVEVQMVVTKFFRQGLVGAIVPSAIVLGEHKLILNPNHPDFQQTVQIGGVEPLNLDKRFNR